MKKSQEIIGLPVFSIVDGKKIGQVKDLVLNPEEAKLDFILVSNGSWYVGARVLPYKAVMGIGQHAVTTESENLLTNINETASANSLLQRSIEIKGNRVLTNKGNLIGVITEYEVDEVSGKITRLEYRSAYDEATIEVIDANQVLTYGSDVIVVKETQEGPGPHFTVPAATEKTLGNTATETEGAAFFKQRQRQFLIGKKVTQDIRDASGNVLIAEGTVVSEEVILLAENNNKYVELTQCVK